MTSAPADLVHHFIEAINDADHLHRRATIHAICAPDFTYTDPDDHAEGPDALDALFARLRTRLPAGFRFTFTGPIDAHHHQARFTWGFGTADAPPVATGSDVAVFTDGTIHRIYSIFDPTPG